ncbi:MAG: HNH endonuclease signature motif containing protein [Actinomyces sp.]|uniref:HNH endonuclease signature motif containing protein n=1 Tax=Actinomyces sp. TaxID=29317 RepID=UPI0026DDAE5E|nr:HNH endonuclease signature motif containing protein [Actinomyces sp.]MDO4242588.1 HNH endonuclease signature motif containing protein [Actinomyces sp.]
MGCIGACTAPIPAATARALAAGGTWRRLVTDPLSGTVVDVGRTRCRPPTALRDLTRARDAACTHPGCHVPTRRCDLDHITPWAVGGTTSLDNLTTLCEAHHRLKHTPGWALSRTSEGALTWRTPSGARYLRDPDGTVVMLPRRVGPRQLAAPARPVPRRLAGAVDTAIVARLERGLEPSGHGDQEHGDQELTARRHLAGDYEPSPHPQPLHDLGLAPLLDEVPPCEAPRSFGTRMVTVASKDRDDNALDGRL